MPLAVAQYLLGLVAIYLALGAGFAFWFVARGAARLDPAAGDGSRGFRVLVFPGAVMLWPLLWRRCVRAP